MTAIEVLDMRDVTREQWLEARVLGSSDSPAIAGLIPEWRTEYKVWAEKLGMIPPFAGNEATEAGLRLQPVIAQWFGDRTGLMLRENTKLFKSPSHDYITATPDYFVMEGGVQGIVECKNTSIYFDKEWKDGVPDAAHIQVMHQLAVTGLTYAYVVGLIGGNKLVWHRIERDEAIIHALIQKLEAFWELVQTKTPPPLTAGDSDTMSALYPESTPRHVVLPQGYDALCQEYLDAKKFEKAATERVDELAARLKAEMADAEMATAGRFQATWKTQTRASYVVKATSFRKFTVKEAK